MINLLSIDTLLCFNLQRLTLIIRGLASYICDLRKQNKIKITIKYYISNIIYTFIYRVNSEIKANFG